MLKIKIGQLLLFIFLSSIILLNNAYAENYGLYKKFNTNKQYDLFFHKYSKQNFGIRFSWLQFKAQAIAESKLDRSAESYVGAQGVMQIMPGTFDEIKRRNRVVKGSVMNPKTNIRAGIWYDREIWRNWSRKETLQDRINFMMASYNAGRGHIINAQKYCIRDPDKYGDPNTWECINNTLHLVTGKHSVETKTYVKRIEGIHSILIGGDHGY